MSARRPCPECGAALSDDTPPGLCPQCLVRMGRDLVAAGSAATIADAGTGTLTQSTPRNVLLAAVPERRTRHARAPYERSFGRDGFTQRPVARLARRKGSREDCPDCQRR